MVVLRQPPNVIPLPAAHLPSPTGELPLLACSLAFYLQIPSFQPFFCITTSPILPSQVSEYTTLAFYLSVF